MKIRSKRNGDEFHQQHELLNYDILFSPFLIELHVASAAIQ